MRGNRRNYLAKNPQPVHRDPKPAKPARLDAHIVSVGMSGYIVCRMDAPVKAGFERICVQISGCEMKEFKEYHIRFAIWNMLRSYRNMKVTLSPKVLETDKKRPTEWGEIPVCFGAIKKKEGGDLGEELVREGIMVVGKVEANEYGNALKAAQAEAQSRQVGVWADPSTFPAPEDLTEDEILAIRCFEGVVTKVVSGTSVTMTLLPSLARIDMNIAGCSSKPPSTPIGEASRTCLLCGLLQNKVTVRICDREKKPERDAKGRFVLRYLGYFTGQTDKVGIQRMIRLGYITYNKVTAKHNPNTDAYIRCELEAIRSKKGVWNTTEPSNKEVELEEFEGKIVQVKSSNCVIIRKNEEEAKDMIFYLACLDVQPCPSVNEATIWALRARDLLKSYMGKNIRCRVTGGYSNRRYVDLYANQAHINAELVKNGFAELVEPFAGERIDHWDSVTASMETAKENKIGIWSTEADEPAIKCNLVKIGKNKDRELVNFIVPLKRTTIDVDIEGIITESKFVVYMPDKRTIFRASVDKVEPWSVESKWFVRAKEYAREKYWHCRARFHILGSSMGYAVGDMEILHPTEGKFSVAHDLIENGVTRFKKSPGPKSDNRGYLMKAEQDAIRNERGIWSEKTMHTINRKVFQTKGRLAVKVACVWDPIKFGVQFMDDEMARVEELLQEDNLVKLEEMPMLDECVVIRNDNGLFVRARVEHVNNSEKTIIANVIDYSTNMHDVSLDSLYKLPEELLNIAPQSIIVSLGLLKLTDKDLTEGVDLIWNICTDARLYMHFMYSHMDNIYVLITDKPDITSDETGSLNYLLISKGIATYEQYQGRTPLKPIFNKAIHSLSIPPEPEAHESDAENNEEEEEEEHDEQ